MSCCLTGAYFGQMAPMANTETAPLCKHYLCVIQKTKWYWRHCSRTLYKMTIQILCNWFIFITMGQWCCSLQGRSRGDFAWALNTVVATRFSCSWSSHFISLQIDDEYTFSGSILASLTCWFSIIKHFTQAFCTGVTDEWLSPRTSAFLSVITLVPLPLPNTLLHAFRQSFFIEMY